MIINNNHYEHYLHQKILRCMGKDFFIMQEVSGFFLVDNSKVRMDFLARPKSHLVENGFDDNWFGIEAKVFRPPKDGSGKLNKLAWQSTTYSQSKFAIPDGAVRPMFVLMCIEGDITDEYHANHWKSIVNFLQYANVGRLEVKDFHEWKIDFNALYFSSSKGKGKSNVGLNRYSGSWKS